MQKTALITGASSGIGAELARQCAAQGHHLVLVARREARLQQLAQELIEKHDINVEILVQDLSLPHAAKQVWDAVQAKKIDIDYLVNNAGFSRLGSFNESDLSQQQNLVSVNIVALTELTHLFLPQMCQRRQGRILNIASTAAFQPGPGMAVYFAAKSYVLSFSQALACELQGTGITVSCVCPGPTATEFQTVAAMDGARLLRFGVMDVTLVAKVAYQSMIVGRQVIIIGLRNKILTLLSQLAPRQWVIKATGYFNKKEIKHHHKTSE